MIGNNWDQSIKSQV